MVVMVEPSRSITSAEFAAIVDGGKGISSMYGIGFARKQMQHVLHMA